MKFHYTNLETCHDATGVVIVIDVIRAFTNAAVAFSRGTKEIYPVSGVEEALQLKMQIPNSLVCGEEGGLPPEGFDFGNSPAQTDVLDLRDRFLVQRTGAGTQGIARSVKAETIFAASFMVAGATTKYIQMLKPEAVTFVVTGQYAPDHGDEDLACAEYLEALFKGQGPDSKPYLERVLKSKDARYHLDLDHPQFPRADLDYCTNLDAFDFAMLVTKENGRHVMRAVKP